MKKSVLTLFVIITVTTIIVLASLGQKGYDQMAQLKSELVELEAANEKLEHENTVLRQEIERLNNDLRYIENVARKDLGLAKEDEIIYHIKKNE